MALVASFAEAKRNQQLAIIAKAWASIPDEERVVVATRFSALATQLDRLVAELAENLEDMGVA